MDARFQALHREDEDVGLEGVPRPRRRDGPEGARVAEALLDALRRPQEKGKFLQRERRALEILEAEDHWTKADIRKAYKALIKVLHPDINGGDRSQEEQLQQVVWAWDQIKPSRNFK